MELNFLPSLINSCVHVVQSGCHTLQAYMRWYWIVPRLYLPWLYHSTNGENWTSHSQACWVSLPHGIILSMHQFVPMVLWPCVRAALQLLWWLTNLSKLPTSNFVWSLANLLPKPFTFFVWTFFRFFEWHECFEADRVFVQDDKQSITSKTAEKWKKNLWSMRTSWNNPSALSHGSNQLWSLAGDPHRGPEHASHWCNVYPSVLDAQLKAMVSWQVPWAL